MKTIRIDYAFKRYGEWFTDKYIAHTKLYNDDITEKILKKEIEKKEMVEIIILEKNEI